MFSDARRCGELSVGSLRARHGRSSRKCGRRSDQQRAQEPMKPADNVFGPRHEARAWRGWSRSMIGQAAEIRANCNEVDNLVHEPGVTGHKSELMMSPASRNT